MHCRTPHASATYPLCVNTQEISCMFSQHIFALRTREGNLVRARHLLCVCKHEALVEEPWPHPVAASPCNMSNRMRPRAKSRSSATANRDRTPSMKTLQSMAAHDLDLVFLDLSQALALKLPISEPIFHIALGCGLNRKRQLRGPAQFWSLIFAARGVENVWHPERMHKELSCHLAPQSGAKARYSRFRRATKT